MNHCYGENLVGDGIFGPATKAALKQTQGKVGVTQDGVYRPNTRAAMKHIATTGGCKKITGPGPAEYVYQ